MSFCNCELRNRQWNPNTGICETCGSFYADYRPVMKEPPMPANDTITPLTDDLRRQIEALRPRGATHLPVRFKDLESLLDELAAAKGERDRLLVAVLGARTFLPIMRNNADVGDDEYEAEIADLEKAMAASPEGLRTMASAAFVAAAGADAKGETPPAQGGADGDDRHL